jgi:hypothetical protein
MRAVKFISVFLLGSLLSQGQSKKADSLISTLRDSQIQMDSNWTGPVFSFKDSTITLLVGEGKQVAPLLLPLLSDTAKGIAAHCVLTDLYGLGGLIRTTIESKSDSTKTYYNYNKLQFYENEERVYSTQAELNRNKKWWINFLKQKSR